MRYFWLFCALGALLGCRTVAEPSGTAIALFCSTYQGAKTESLTVGEEVAVYACPEGTEAYFLEAALFTVGSDGRSLSYGSTVYYPDPKQAVRFFAYFPYHTEVFSVPTDQSKPEALKEADLCGAVARTTPVPTPVALAFEHLLARLVITTNKPTTRIVFPNALSSGVVHAATAELVLGAERKDISTTGGELIVPAQPLTRLVLTVSGVEYVFDGSVSLEAGKTTTLDLTLHPATKTATLSGSSVTDWVATTTPGNLTQAVSNTLTVHWPKSHPQSNAVDRIVLTVKDEVSGVTANYTVANGITYANQTFTIPFASSALHYPYTMVSVALYQNKTEWLHESPNVLGGTIIKSGACVVGIRQPLNTPTADDYVTINGLNWAKGNLVAVSSTNNRECKVGEPEDGGLYFQFGSLIGYKGGNQTNRGTGVGIPQAPLTINDAYWDGAAAWGWENEAMVWPTGLIGTKTSWTNTTGVNITTLSDYYFNYSMAPWERAQNIRDFAVAIIGDTGAGTLATGRYAPKGVGDPCTYYLGEPWRLPTTTEIASITGKTGGSWIPWTTVGVTGRWATAAQTFAGVAGPGAWFGPGLKANVGIPISLTNPFFPVSGYRTPTNGSFNAVIVLSLGWSSSVSTATLSYYPSASEPGGVIPQYIGSRANALPVRCVSE